MLQCALFFCRKSFRFISDSNPKLHNLSHKFLSHQSASSIQTEFPIPITNLIPSVSSPVNPNPNFQQRDFDSVVSLLENPNLLPSKDLGNALEEMGIEPSPSLLVSIFKRLDSSPNHVFSIYKWAEERLGFQPSALIFNSMLKILVKSGEFKWALMVLLDQIKRGDGSQLVSPESVGILIRQYARSGMTLSAIRMFEFAKSLEMNLFEVLLDALSRYGHVLVASDCIVRKKYSEPDWVPSINAYNMLLEGWFQVGDLNRAEQLWLQMRREKLVPEAVTYGILVEGYCRMGFVDKAVELLGEMRRHGLGPSKAVYGPIVEALARAGRFKEALGMLERFLVLDPGPTLSTYNSLVKGFCKAGDLIGAGKVLKMMISRGIMPTATSYNYFFRYFSKHGKVEEGINLYRKMLESGYDPDQQTFHLMLKMMCEQDKLEFAMQISKEMRSRGHVMDLATSSMMINFLCKMHKFREAVVEFEDLIQRGFVPKYLTYQTLHKELKKKGLHELALKITVPYSTMSPSTFERLAPISHQRRKSIMRRAKAMSNILKTCSDPRDLAKSRRPRSAK